MPLRPIRRHPWLLFYFRIGIASLSLLYLLSGSLTALSAMGLGGKRVDQQDIVPYLFRLPLGRITLFILALGMGGYVLWRLTQVWTDPAGFGAGPKGLCIRAGYLISGLLYASLAGYALRMVWEDRSRRPMHGAPLVAAALLEQPHGPDLVRAVAVAIFILGLVQFFRAFTERFRRQIPDLAVNRRFEHLIRWSGRIGFTARGVVLVVIARLFQVAADHANAREAGGVGKAWDFLGKGRWGHETLAMVAACIAVYGVFLGVKAWGLGPDLKG
jgi:hypothetical protein